MIHISILRAHELRLEKYISPGVNIYGEIDTKQSSNIYIKTENVDAISEVLHGNLLTPLKFSFNPLNQKCKLMIDSRCDIIIKYYSSVFDVDKKIENIFS